MQAWWSGWFCVKATGERKGLQEGSETINVAWFGGSGTAEKTGSGVGQVEDVAARQEEKKKAKEEVYRYGAGRHGWGKRGRCRGE